jgi:hypothetical protein
MYVSRCRFCERFHGLPRCSPPEESVSAPGNSVTPEAQPQTNAQRQAAYRERHREAVRAYDRERKRGRIVRAAD